LTMGVLRRCQTFGWSCKLIRDNLDIVHACRLALVAPLLDS
jgi:hypothetical protein